MPQHFVNLPGAVTLPTRQYQLAGQIIEDLIAESATGVVHGPAGPARRTRSRPRWNGCGTPRQAGRARRAR